ncbi:MAG: DinB family protein [Acidobacteriota bacterium]
MSLRKPDPSELHPFYAGYVALAPDDDVLDHLENDLVAWRHRLGELPDEVGSFRYGDGKWSLGEMVGHLIDSDWTFSYRALFFARGAAGALPGMDQDQWAASPDASRRPLAELLDAWSDVRSAAAGLFRGITDDAWARVGTADGKQFTARCLPYLMVGHARHHLRTLDERYLPALRASG